MQLVLARILTPKDYGVLAIVLVFINLSTVFIESGLPTALIQKKNTDQKDFSSVFFVSLAISLVIIAILWVCAPLIANFYEDGRLTDFVRVSSFILLVGVYNSVQLSVLARRMEFKKNFISSLIGVVASAIVGIWMAVRGYGVWALVANYMVNICINTFTLSFLVRWRPHFVCSLGRIKPLFKFGYKILLARMILNFSNDLYSLVIGKKFTKAGLGYYETGNKIPFVATTALASAIISVLLPAFSKIQDDLPSIKDLVSKSYKVSSFFIFPLMALLCVSARPLIEFLLTSKWEMAVPFMQIGCGIFIFVPMINCVNQSYNALGRSDVFLSIEVKKKIIEVVILFSTIWISLLWVALGRLIATVIGMYFVMKPAKKLFGYTLFQQIKDILPTLLISLVVGGMMSVFLFVGLRSVYVLILQWTLGLTLYVYLSKRYNQEVFGYLLAFGRRLKNR